MANIVVDVNTLRRWAADLPGTTEDVKWGADLCLCVGAKMYCVYGLESGGFSFKSDPVGFATLTKRPGFGPAPYVARYHWVRVDPGVAVDEADMQALVAESYRLVVAALPKRLRP